MPDKLMSPERHQQLVKAAEDTIGLMNIGIDGNAALCKVAEDADLNDNEVTVVAHAVNNSRQLAHLQTSTGDDRESAFPLIDPEKVRPHGDTQPTTNADEPTGERYGKQEEPGDSTEQKVKDPDAVEIHEELSKAASASYYSSDDFRLRADTPDFATMLREDWGLATQPKLAEFTSTVPFSKISHYRIGIEEGQMRYLRKVEACESSIAKVAEAMRRTDAPRWAEVEKVAAQLGAEPATLDLIYAASGVEKFGDGRADLSVKTAGTLYTTQRVQELAEECVRADTFWKEAADVHAATTVLKEHQQEAEASLFPKEAGAGKGKEHISIDLSPAQLVDPISDAPAEFTGEMTSDTLRGAFGIEKKRESPEAWEGPSPELRRELGELKSQVRIQRLLTDDFISGHSMPEVIDAYNAAMSVNPNLGQAELVSYVRQHLATQGAVPLDLQIRARPRTQLSLTQSQEEEDQML